LDNGERLFKIYDRFLEVISLMDKKYVMLLEEIVFKEAEIMSKDKLSRGDELRLWGYRYIKNLIAKELGLAYKPVENIGVEKHVETRGEAIANA